MRIEYQTGLRPKESKTVSHQTDAFYPLKENHVCHRNIRKKPISFRSRNSVLHFNTVQFTFLIISHVNK